MPRCELPLPCPPRANCRAFPTTGKQGLTPGIGFITHHRLQCAIREGRQHIATTVNSTAMTPVSNRSSWGPPTAPCTTSIATSQPAASSLHPCWGRGTACPLCGSQPSVPEPGPAQREAELRHSPSAQLPAGKINKRYKKHGHGQAACNCSHSERGRYLLLIWIL